MSGQLTQTHSLQGTDFANFSVFVPDSVKFKPVKAGLSARRVPIKWRSAEQTYATNGNKLVRIILPDEDLYDTRAGYLSFDLVLTKTGGTYARIHSGIFSIFNKFRCLVNSTEVENIINYNDIMVKLWEMTNPNLTTGNIGVTSLGFGTQVQRNAQGAAASTSYACPLMSGVLNTELLPFDNLSTGMVIELTLEDPLMCVETDGTNPVISISNVVFHMERLELDESYRNYVASHVRSHGLQLGFHTWERNINALTQGTMQNIAINSKNSSVNGILNFFKLSSEASTTTVNDKFLTWLPLGMTSFQLNVNGRIFPDEPIDCVSINRFEPFQMYCRWAKKWKLNGQLDQPAPINSQVFPVNRYVFICDFEPFPECDDLVNPFTTLGNSANIIIKITFDALIPANYQLDSWLESFRQIKIASNGKITVLA